jgi:hypothetical protein
MVCVREQVWLGWIIVICQPKLSTGGRPLVWRMGKGRSKEGVSGPRFIFKYLSFWLLPITLSR